MIYFYVKAVSSDCYDSHGFKKSKQIPFYDRELQAVTDIKTLPPTLYN